MNKFLLAIILSVAVVSLAACVPTSTNTTTTPEASSDEPADFTLELSSFEFTPNVIETEAGKTIKIKLVGEDIDHDFIIDGLEVRSPIIKRGQSKTVEVTIPADASGKSFEFYCGVGSHKEQGMIGTLKVK